MKNMRPSRLIPYLAVAAVVLSMVPGGLAQEQAPAPAPAPPSQGSQTPPAGGVQQGGGGRQGTAQPATPERTQPSIPDIPRPIYLSGSVRLSDGSIPPTSVVIERVCAGVTRPEAYTDSRGNFSFLVGGQNSAIIPDASVGADPFSRNGQSTVTERSLTGCEIRASLAGFQSDSIILGFRQALDDPEIGVIHLHRLANVEGYTFSISTAAAPKDARKAYESGLNSVKKQKWPDAERDFSKAVQIYPKYAVAWYELGRVYQQQKKYDDANRAHMEAIKIDSKYINPYGQLIVISTAQQKWDDVAQYTAQITRLNPYLSPEIYFYGAVANYNLKNIETAEGHARQAAKLDTQHRIPRIDHLLGLIMVQKQDYKAAAEHIRAYLKWSPDATDAETVRQLLDDLEKEPQ